MKFRWAYIGCGGIAASTSGSIEKGEHVISAVYSRSYEKAEGFAKKHNAVAYRTPQEAIENCDGVYIATPHTSHVEYALLAMKMGKPVLCEKPVGVTKEDAVLLTETAEKENVYFCEAMWTWFSPVALKVKEWIKDGKIGELKEVKIHHAFPGLLKPKNGRVRNPMTAGGALLDIGIYPITYCLNLFGYPDKIECEGEIKDGIDIGETVTLTYKNAPCKLYMSYKYLKEDCVIEGTEGTITVPLFHVSSMAKLKSRKGNETFLGKTDYLTEFNEVAKEIRKGKTKSDFIPPEMTVRALEIMDECRRQMGLVYPFEK